MREIKFRLWNCVDNDPKKSKMFYDQDKVIECLEQELTGYYLHSKDGSVFMQYTGLKDKSGKEIYEGDLIRHRYGVYEVKFFTELCWDGGCPHPGFYLTHLNNHDDFEEMDYHLNFDDIEVIGNIHENPELLEK